MKMRKFLIALLLAIVIIFIGVVLFFAGDHDEESNDAKPLPQNSQEEKRQEISRDAGSRGSDSASSPLSAGLR
jgi:hypothetical protein